MKKYTKRYNLALKKQADTEKHHFVDACSQLNVISQAPQNLSCQDISTFGRPNNIFEHENCQPNKKLGNQNLSRYSILCYKQVEAYKSRIKKIRNLGIVGLLRMKNSESILSSSRQTGTFAELASNADCLTKDQLGDFYNKTKVLFQQLKKTDKSTDKYKDFHSQRLNYQQSKQQLNKTSRLHQLNLSNKQSLLKWNQNSIRSNASLNQLHMLNNCASLHKHRKKMQSLSKQSLKNQKQNIQPISWNKNLRNPQPLKNIFNDKFVQQIDRQGFKLLGMNKLDKQYNWINQKKIQYFEPLDSKIKYIKRCKGNNDESRVIKSVISNNSSHFGNPAISIFGSLMRQ